MKDELKQAAEAIATHPKTSIFVAGAANFNAWWMNWGEPIINAATSVLGVVLLVIMIMYHWQNMKKIKRENDKG